jgi:hypothetical protein
MHTKILPKTPLQTVVHLPNNYPIDWALRVDGVFIMNIKILITTKNHASMQEERALHILVGKQKQCIEITHSGLVDCCEFACCGYAHDTINLSIAPIGIALGSSDQSIATADNDNAYPLPPHPCVPISAGASISLVSSETMIFLLLPRR